MNYVIARTLPASRRAVIHPREDVVVRRQLVRGVVLQVVPGRRAALLTGDRHPNCCHRLLLPQHPAHRHAEEEGYDEVPV